MMKNPTTQDIEAVLINILSDGFNRSFGALRAVGVIDEQKLAEKYRGVGSEYYDLVTAKIELSARYAVPGIRSLFFDENNEVKKL